MCASPLSLLRAGPPPPKVVLLPDAVFFTRTLTVAAGATPAETTTQIELALEAVSPFPLAQLNYGWFAAPGCEHVLVFAAYRRRFTSDQAASWEGTELVLPTFAALLGAKVEPSTTYLLAAPEGLTAVHWEAGPVPAKVLFRPLPPEPTDEQRAQVREELIRAIGGTKNVVDLAQSPVALPRTTDSEIEFRAGDIVSTLPASVTASLDVRDKAELATLRAAQKRDVLLWQVLMGCAAALALLIVGELALFGGRAWLGTRKALQGFQKPHVEKIMSSQALAFRIEELATKRLLPFEMMSAMYAENRRPGEVQFRVVRANQRAGIHVISVEGTATNGSAATEYKAALEKLPEVASVEIRDFRTVGNTATFNMVVTFKPDAIKPAESIAQAQ